MNRLLLFFVLLFSVSIASSHPLKMTTGRMYYDKEKQTCMLSINFYVDDFSAWLTDIYYVPITEENITDSVYNPLLQDYLKKNVFIFSADSEAILHLDEAILIEENVLQISLTVDKFQFSENTEIKVVNTLLFNAFDNQMNILHIELYEKKEVVQFTAISPSYTFSL